MNKNRMLIYKVTVGAVLAGLSIVLKLAFDLWIRVDFFGFPFYSIPLILAGLILDPLSALLAAFAADTIGGIVLGYFPMFVFSTLVWALVPSLITKKAQGARWWLVILITYLLATSFNTLAIGVHFSWDAAKNSLPIRLPLIPMFGPIIAIVTELIYERIKVLNLDLK